MPQAQVEATLYRADSTVRELLEAHEDICIQYGYLAATSGHGIRRNVEADLVETLRLMTLIKERIDRKSNSIVNLHE
ncbi:MAG: hypothetical protein M3N42_16930 [Cyanobacteriota bacterium]|nr:hypothetical protein [Cyanobacteriota bacterium]